MLMHCQRGGTWPADTVRWQDGILEAKSRRVVLGVGASVHGLPALRRLPRNRWVEIAMIRTEPLPSDAPTVTSAPVEVGLYAIGKISGRVLDAAGRGVPKVRIDLSDQTPPGGGWMFQADEKGEFNSEGVPSRGRLEGTENEQGRAWSATISRV